MKNMIDFNMDSKIIKFETGGYYFSPKKVDEGTKALLSMVEWRKDDRVLDLGCGYGVIGIYAAKKIGACQVTMCDISQEAVALTKENCKLNDVPEIKVIRSDGFSELGNRRFTLILSNPPFHSDFSVAKRFITEGYRYLEPGGRMMLVTKRKTWYKNKLISVFGGVKVWEVNGYYVFCAEKRAHRNNGEPEKRKLSKKLQRKVNRRL